LSPRDCLTSLHLSRTPAFFFSAPSPTHIYTLSLHDALPISPTDAERPRATPSRWSGSACSRTAPSFRRGNGLGARGGWRPRPPTDRKSTRLNSSHVAISYAVFCLKKKKKQYAPVYTASSYNS